MTLDAEEKRQVEDVADEIIKRTEEEVLAVLRRRVDAGQGTAQDIGQHLGVVNAFSRYTRHIEGNINSRAGYFLVAHSFLFAGYVQSARDPLLVNLSLLPPIIGTLLAGLWIVLGFRDWASHRAASSGSPNGSPEAVASEFRNRVAKLCFNLPAVPGAAVGIPAILFVLWSILTLRLTHHRYQWPKLAYLASHPFSSVLIAIGLLMALPCLIFYVDDRWFPKKEPVNKAELTQSRMTERGWCEVLRKSWGWILVGGALVFFGAMGLCRDW